MKAVFKGYKNKDHAIAGFTVGKVYLVTETERSDFFYVVDDTGFGSVLNINGVFYHFEVLAEDNPQSYGEAFDYLCVCEFITDDTVKIHRLSKSDSLTTLMK